MRQSEEIDKISKALLVAQKRLTIAKKDESNAFLKNKFASLVSVIKAVKGPLNDAGITFIQPPVTLDDKSGVVTRLVHESGQWLEATLLMPLPKQDPQAVGSAVSYARRYCLMSWLGIPQADDDAELAMPERKSTKKKAKATPKHAAATKALNATKSMDELKSIWVTFDEATRTALTDLKNELKDKFDESA